MKTYINPTTTTVVTTETLMQSYGASAVNPLEFKVVSTTSQDNAL